jgi:hypothetical protein
MLVGWPPEIALPLTSFLAILTSFLALPFAGNRLDRLLAWQYRCLIFWLVPGCGLAVLTLIYLAYERVGWPLIDQAEGRHFIPLLPLFGVFLMSVGAHMVKHETTIAARCVIVAVQPINAIVLIMVVCARYHLALL